MSDQGESSEQRDPRLDGLRGLAIALVLLFHTTRFDLATERWQAAVVALPALGWSGVDLFFVLSGFLITGILLRTRTAPRYFRTFYARRTLRIFPLYYACLVFFIVIAPRITIGTGDQIRPLGAPVEDPIWYWTYLSNIGVVVHGGSRHLLDVTWSLAIEEQFYLLWPFVVRHASERRLLGICVAAGVIGLALRSALAAAGAPPVAAYMLTPCRLDTLATGAAIALVAARPGGLQRLAGHARAFLLVALAGFAAVWTVASGDVGKGSVAAGFDPVAPGQHPLMQTLGFTLLCAIYGSLLVCVVTAPAASIWARCFEARVLRSLGKYSYALYLLHLPIAVFVMHSVAQATYRTHFLLAQAQVSAVAIGAAYLLARISWVVLEEPVLSLKRRFPYRVASP